MCNSVNTNRDECRDCKYPHNVHYPDLWQCPKCYSIVEGSAFCDNCGYEMGRNVHYVSEEPKTKSEILDEVVKQEEV